MAAACALMTVVRMVAQVMMAAVVLKLWFIKNVRLDALLKHN
jgi:hypothetical protein